MRGWFVLGFVPGDDLRFFGQRPGRDPAEHFVQLALDDVQLVGDVAQSWFFHRAFVAVYRWPKTTREICRAKFRDLIGDVRRACSPTLRNYSAS